MIKITELTQQLSESPQGAGVLVTELDEELPLQRGTDLTEELGTTLPEQLGTDLPEGFDPYAPLPIPELYLG
jgi:hypothetical protein